MCLFIFRQLLACLLSFCSVRECNLNRVQLNAFSTDELNDLLRLSSTSCSVCRVSTAASKPHALPSSSSSASSAAAPSDGEVCRNCSLDGGRRRRAAALEALTDSVARSASASAGAPATRENGAVPSAAAATTTATWREREERDRARDRERENALLLRALPVANPSDPSVVGASAAIRRALEEMLRACDACTTPDAAHTLFEGLAQLFRMRQRCERQMIAAAEQLGKSRQGKGGVRDGEDEDEDEADGDQVPTRDRDDRESGSRAEIAALTDAVQRYERFAVQIRATMVAEQNAHRQSIAAYQQRIADLEGRDR